MRLKDSYDLESNIELYHNDFKQNILSENKVSPLEKYRKK